MSTSLGPAPQPTPLHQHMFAPSRAHQTRLSSFHMHRYPSSILPVTTRPVAPVSPRRPARALPRQHHAKTHLLLLGREADEPWHSVGICETECVSNRALGEGLRRTNRRRISTRRATAAAQPRSRRGSTNSSGTKAYDVVPPVLEDLDLLVGVELDVNERVHRLRPRDGGGSGGVQRSKCQLPESRSFDLNAPQLKRMTNLGDAGKADDILLALLVLDCGCKSGGKGGVSKGRAAARRTGARGSKTD